MSDHHRAKRTLALIAFTLGAVGALSITLAFVAPESQNLFLILLRAPGALLRSSFHIASLYVPLMLVAGGVMLIRRDFHRAHVITLVASTMPFLTAALVFRLAASSSLGQSPLTRIVSDSLGRTLGLTTTLLLLVIELAALYLLWLRLTKASPFWVPHSGTRPASGDLTGGMARISGLLEAPKEIKSRQRAAGPEPFSDEKPVADEFELDQEGSQRVPESLIDLPEPGDDGLELRFESGRFSPESSDRAPHPVTEDETNDTLDLDEEPLDEATTDAGFGAYEVDVFADAEIDYDEPDEDPRDVDHVGDDEEDEIESDEFEDAEFDYDDDSVEDDEPSRPPIPKPRGKRYDVPIDTLLDHHSGQAYWHIDEKTREAAETLRITLDEFGIQAEVTGIRKGPVITMFEILPAPGVKLSKIVNLSDNIALRLAAASVRIVAPIPGKHAVGIEIPNAERAIVGFAELLQEESFQAPQAGIPIALGKDIPGDAQIVDLARMPHVLIAGATGSGKSVCVNSMICSILYRRAPHEVKLILIDPKIVELKFYNDIPHLLTPVITDPKRAFQALQYCIYEMERRYSLLDALQVRDIQSYNRKIVAKKLATEPLPYIVVVVHEFADLMATSGKELESTLARLAAMSRAVGIHLVLATQRPSTDVITGLIKANIPSRIAFMVASKVDSRIILDAMGAEKLLGRGDMLFTSAWDPFPLRMQGAFLSDEEVERVVEYVKQLGEPEYIDDEIFVEDEDEEFAQGELEDPLMEKAIEIVTTAGKASASYLQRRLKVGYNRAARMVEEMERLGIVGPQQGSKPREVIAGG